MSMLKINGVDMPSPSGITPGIMDLSSAERNARGTMIIDRVGTKDKLEFSWSVLNQAQMAQLLNAVKNPMFTVTFMHPLENRIVTKTFYSGDRTMTVLDCINGVYRYKELKMNFVER